MAHALVDRPVIHDTPGLFRLVIIAPREQKQKVGKNEIRIGRVSNLITFDNFGGVSRCND
jgi:hypothetical protein